MENLEFIAQNTILETREVQEVPITTKIESQRFERPIFISLIAIDLIFFLIAFGLAYKITKTTGYGMQCNLYNQNRQKFKYT